MGAGEIGAVAVLFLKPREPVAHLFSLTTLLGTATLILWPIADLGQPVDLHNRRGHRRHVRARSHPLSRAQHPPQASDAERNQQQMAEEIHRRLLQDLATAQLFLDEARAAHPPDEGESAQEILLEMAGYLRTVLFEPHPPAWDHSDLQTVLEDYAWNF